MTKPKQRDGKKLKGRGGAARGFKGVLIDLGKSQEPWLVTTRFDAKCSRAPKDVKAIEHQLDIYKDLFHSLVHRLFAEEFRREDQK